MARFHGRERRGLDREQPQSVKPESGTGVDEAVAADLPPDRAAEMDDELARLLSVLDPEEQQCVDLKLQEHTNAEIAKKIGCSERTVRRVFQRVQSRLRDILEDSSRDLA